MPANLILWVFFTAIYAAVLAVRRVSLKTISKNLGLRVGKWYWYVAALGVAVLSVGVALLVFWLSQFSITALGQNQSLTGSHYASWVLGPVTFLHAFGRELVYTAFGEELFFRGLIGGWLFRHLNFQLANGLQTLVFLLPHLAILALVGMWSWPLLIPALVAGWLLGLMRHASGSIFPGVLAHGLVNAVAAAYFMVAV